MTKTEKFVAVYTIINTGNNIDVQTIGQLSMQVPRATVVCVMFDPQSFKLINTSIAVEVENFRKESWLYLKSGSWAEVGLKSSPHHTVQLVMNGSRLVTEIEFKSPVAREWQSQYGTGLSPRFFGDTCESYCPRG